MIGMNLYKSRIGTVAIFATLFVALQVNGEKCVFDFESGSGASNFDFDCNGMKNSWVTVEPTKDKSSNFKKSVVLEAEQVGCLKTKSAIPLNSTTKVVLKLGKRSSDDIHELTVRLIPTEGSCTPKECVWAPANNAKTTTSEGVFLTHEFPVEGIKEYHIQVEVGKRKGKFELESISVPDLNDSKKCHRAADSGAVASGDVKIESLDKKPAYMLKYVGRAINETADETAKPPNPPASETAHNSSPPSTHPHESTTHKKAAAPGVIDISKNLMLTSVSVLALNHLIN